MIVLTDIIMPDRVLAAGVRGKQMHRNTRTEAAGGQQRVNANWRRSLREYELGFVPMRIAAWQDLEALFEVTQGGAFGFLMRDPKDQAADATQGLLQPCTVTSGRVSLVGTAGQGNGLPQAQLLKRYTSAGSSRSTDRPITRPMAGALLYSNAAALSGASLNTDTGVVSFASTASASVLSAVAGSQTQLGFSAGSALVAALSAGQYVYITGMSNEGGLLNNKAHLVSNITGDTLTLATSTTGLTLSGGLAYKYPQPADVLSWAGGFYVPVHFAGDELDWELLRGGPLDGRLVAGPLVRLAEVRE